MNTMLSLFNYSRRILPKISQTEKIALTCGTVGFDKSIFSGNSCATELSKYSNSLNDTEEAYLSGTVDKICKKFQENKTMSRGHNIVPENVINCMKTQGIFGMLIPEKYNGNRFNTHARSQIVQKLSSCNGALGVIAMVPNSLGPGELLIHYGTQAQQEYFLPKLASGELMPCFGLTSWAAGSDAAGSMIDTAIVRKKSSGEEELYLEVSVNKRYITLAPIANLIGLAVKLEDPDNLLKETRGGEGITVLILEKEKEELDTSKCHNPLDVGFPNGTIKAERLNVPIDSVIGGVDNCGEGWKMLMECLSEGRAVSLPSTAVAASKKTTLGTLAYSRVRKQFKTPIYKMEGVADKLVNMITNTVTITAAQHLTNAIIDNGEKPSVLSAVMKYKTTEIARDTLNHGMDIMGGSGICLGDKNFVADFYRAAPIGITVEGSNTLTRSLIVFGQGLMRSHPYLLNIVESIEQNNRKSFYSNVGGLIGSSVLNTIVSITPTLSSDIETHLNCLSKSFFLASNLMLTLGKRFKTSEMLSGRYADIFSNIYLSYSLLWYRDKNNVSEEMKFIIEKSIQHLLYDSQEKFKEISSNFPGYISRAYLKLISFPYGDRYAPVSDNDKKKIIEMAVNSKELHSFLGENIYLDENHSHFYKLVNTLEIELEDIPEELIEELCQVDEY